MDLATLGIAADEERAYRHLVTRGRNRATDVAAALGLPVQDTTAVLGSLHEAGLVSVEDEVYRAAPPELALRSLLVRRRDELGRAEAALTDLAAAFQTGQGDDSLRTLVEVVVGADEVRRRFAQVQSAATERVRAFVKAEHTVVAAQDNSAEGEALRRGVRYDVVVERPLLERPGMLEQIAATVEAGERIRATDELPLRMLIADHDVALVPLSAEGEVGAVVVRRSGLLDALVGLFERTWERSRDVLVPLDGGEELDEQIVSLLLQGYGDKAISHQLAVSPRTVQRRVRALMDRAAATSRIQLGFWLAQRSDR
ncbi:transcriptional regulator TrmB [Ornithinimicrobium sp. F0845]|uniref:helix-turn-helix domain-containing protein n=1 Tax=Ornithinimicrobium sp. F0845 TaxID=2926412 RepID=UPI001FF2FFC6|nr:helix-turn-helix domain-containing protein [Ornithinimicrobium sp. F0845]MCK0112915.1 transcriptional regulator TrmB [Ornithinimicrobium sp. F0845]